MNRRLTNPRRFLFRLVVVLFILCVPAVPHAPASTDTSPLPASSEEHGWFQSLRIRFFNRRLLDKARAALRHGAPDAAERHLQEALQNDPGSNRAKVALLEVYQQTGRTNRALEVCNELIEQYPGYVDGYMTKAFLAAQQGDHATAIQAFESVLAHTDASDARHQRARSNLAPLYYQSGNVARAEDFAQWQIQHNETYAARMLLAECAIAQTNRTAALTHLDAALPLAATREQKGTVYLKKGYLYSHLGQFEQAKASLETASDLVSDKVDQRDIARQLGETALQQERYAQAIRFLGTVLEEEFDEHIAAGYMEAMTRQASPARAAGRARAFLEREGLSAEFRARMLRHLVYLNKQMKDPEATYRAAEALYALEPATEILLELAYAAERRGATELAAKHFKAYLAQAFRVDVAMSYYYLLKSAGDLDKGAQLLNRVLRAGGLTDEQRIEALYERAQIYLAAERMDEYLRQMEDLVSLSDNIRFYLEYAAQLVAMERYEAAIHLYERQLAVAPDDADRFAICRAIATAYLAMGRPQDARTWLDRALDYGLPDIPWHLAMARVDYAQGHFDRCVKRLLSLNDDRDVVQLYLGFSFYQMHMPGLALHHLRRVAAPDDLPPGQRYNLFANLAYLAYDQGLHEDALDHVERALRIQTVSDMEVVAIKARMGLGDYARAREQAASLLASRDALLRKALSTVTRRHPDSPLKWALLRLPIESGDRIRVALTRLLRRHDDDPALKMDLMILLAHASLAEAAELLELGGLCEIRLDRPRQAVALLSDCITLAPLRPNAYFLRGLAYFELDDYARTEQDFERYRASSRVVSQRFWAELGVVKGKRGKYREGTSALRRALTIHPYDIDSMEEAGYQFMKWPSNAQAQASFQHTIDTYDIILPYLESDDQAAYRTNQLALKREVTKLARRAGGQFYLNKTDYDFAEAGIASAVDGALPSQLGAELNVRPPVVGFRNERTVDVFGRILANFESDSWEVNADSYQGGLGLRYKPLQQVNAVTSFERLFKIGDNSENNWLWRMLASREWGTRPGTARSLTPSGRVYGDVGLFLDDPRRWYYYLDGRAGLTLAVHNTFRLTLPQALGIVRYESDDATDRLSYTLAGLGLSGRLTEPEQRYVTERWYVDVHAHYVWGWFRDRPADLDDTSFDGLVFGINFVK